MLYMDVKKDRAEAAGSKSADGQVDHRVERVYERDIEGDSCSK